MRLSLKSIERVVCSFLTRELQAMRPAYSYVGRLDATSRLRHGGLELDSLEMIAVAGGISDFFHVHETGLEDLLLGGGTVSDWVAIIARSQKEYCGGYTFHTSGSQGTAKACTHMAAALMEEVVHWEELLAGSRRILSAVPAHHIYGFLLTVLLPEVAGWEVVDIRHWTPSRLLRECRPYDTIVGHPEFWGLLARQLPGLPSSVAAVSSSAPLPELVHQRLLGLGFAMAVDIYGSAELGGMGFRTEPTQPFTLLPHWRRDSADSSDLWRTERSALPPDRLRWVDERRFFVDGRLDSAVQVNGINVYPQVLADHLRAHPAVMDAAVRLMLPHEGKKLKAYVTLHSSAAGAAAQRSELFAWCERHLLPEQCPGSITYGAALPRNSMGKLADWPIAHSPAAQSFAESA